MKKVEWTMETLDNQSAFMRNIASITKEPKNTTITEEEIVKPYLNKIKSEIIDTAAYEQEVNGKTEFLKGINYCLSVIDKYTVESEDKE